MSILAVADVTIGDMLRAKMQQLMFISSSYCQNMECFNFCVMLNVRDEFLSFVKIGVYYSQAIISTKLVQFSVVMKGGKRLLRKGYKRFGLW